MATNYLGRLFLLLSLLLAIPGATLAFDSAEEYFEKWKTTEFTRLVPFGAEYFDKVQTGTSFDPTLDIHFKIPFFGRTYSKASLTQQGSIVLGNLQTVPWGTKLPNEKYDGSDDNPDPSMLAVYFADSMLDPTDPSSVNHRIVDPNLETPGSLEFDVAVMMLEQIQHDIKWAIVGAEHFHPSAAVVVTWYDVTFSCRPSGGNKCPTNTFQAVLATDGNETYTIFNYHKLTWENSVRENCDLDSGTTTPAYPNCFSAQVGFNAGQGREFFPLPYSNTESVIYLDEMASHAGRYVYEVSGEIIRRGECLKLDSHSTQVDPDSWPLVAWPNSLSTLGGQELHVSGPCLLDTDDVVCQFREEINVRAHILDSLRAVCIVPKMFKPGDVTVQLIINGQPSPWTPAHIFLENPGSHKMPVGLVQKQQWLSMTSEELAIAWDPSHMIPPKYLEVNATQIGDIPVDIVLYGYRENDVEKPEWPILTTLGQGQPNSGSFVFKPAEHRCEGDVCSWAQAGALKVVRSGGEPDQSHGIFSSSFPLQWFVTAAMEKEYGPDWPREKCIEWKEDNNDWTRDLAPCPCFFNQALNDKVWIRDPDCEDFVTIPELPNPCIFQPVSSRCFVPAGPKDEGQSSKCCYSNEGHLMYSGENNAGSYSSVIHPDGMPPYEEIGKVPHWSNWVKDKMPYLLCCKWPTNKDQCIDHFLRKRPTPDCKDFQPPGHGAAFGDPHFRTFDGTTYTFNGHGEFWFVKIDSEENIPDFKLQARMEIPNWPEITASPMYVPAMNATVLTAVAMLEGNVNQAPKVEMRLNAPISKTKVSVLVDEKIVSFSDGVRRREFWGRGDESQQRVLIIGEGLPDPWTREFANFSVIFRSGIVVRVAGNTGLLQVNVVLPRHYFGIPRGLLGAWTGKKDQDLINRNGDLVEPISNEHIHKNFGMTWLALDSETLFMYIANMKWDKFYDPNFQPYFELNDISPSPSEPDLARTCGDNFACRYDYMTLFNAPIAAESLAIEIWMNDVDKLSAYVPACEHITVPFIKSADRSPGYFLPDGEIHFTECQDGYSIRGNTIYKCEQQDGLANWNPEPDVLCKSNKEISNEDSRLAAAIAVPICLVVLIAAIIGAVFFMRKRKTPKLRQSIESSQNRKSDIDSNDEPPNFNQSRLSFIPNPMGSLDKLDDLHRSSNSINSTTSDYMVLAARPPRPKSTQPKLTRQSRASYEYPVELEDGSTLHTSLSNGVSERQTQPKDAHDNPAISSSLEDLQNKDNISKDGVQYYTPPLWSSKEDLHRQGLVNETPIMASLDYAAQPYRGSLGNLSRPDRASQENFSKPYRASQENLSAPYKASHENLAGPYRPSQENLSAPYRASRENLAGPYRASQENFSKPNRASQENLSAPYKASHENLAGPYLASQENLSAPYRASRENLAGLNQEGQHLTGPVRAYQEDLTTNEIFEEVYTPQKLEIIDGPQYKLPPAYDNANSNA